MKPGRSMMVAAATWLVLFPYHCAVAKNASIGIYAIVDGVTVQPNGVTWPNSFASLACLSFPLLCRAVGIVLPKEAIFISSLRPATSLRPAKTGTNSSGLPERAWSSGSANIGSPTRMIRREIRTIL
jgi:hypothetical protein